MKLFKKENQEDSHLTDEEKQKIIEEEKLRADLRKNEEKKKQSKKGIGCLLVIIIFIIFVVILSSGGNDTSTPAQGTSENMAFIQSQAYVKDFLKSPGSADFPFADFSYIDHEDDSYTIQSYVDSQNSFGAMIRSDYTATLKYLSGDDADPNSWELQRLIIEGQQVYP